MKIFIFFRITLIAILLNSCNGVSSDSVLSKSDSFIGEWKLYKNSLGVTAPNNYMNMKISKDDIFYKVEYLSIQNGKILDIFDESLNAKQDKQDPQTRSFIDSYHKYQLSPDKRFLMCITDPTTILMYDENENVIQSSLFGWFKKK
jgi:hypothetical protein